MTPFGVPEANPARGMFFGNRGCLVNARGEIVRPWQGERWITCLLEFKGRRRRPLMAPGKYTELFFLDEATALAAGHRPCAECRRADLNEFRAAWLEVHPGDSGRLVELDHRLHAERIAPERVLTTCRSLPDGTMVELGGAAWLVHGGRLRAWTHAGYAKSRTFPRERVAVLTPPSVVEVLRAGWRPALHPTA